MRTLTVGLACLVITLAAVPPLPAQDATDGPSVQWSLVSSDFADLWFGGLAQVGFMGFDSVPLYDAAYASGVRGHKVAQGVGQTLLDRDADGLRIMFEADPAFEVLHFVPVYFAGVGRAETLDALEAIAESPSGIPDAPSTGSRFGTTAVATVLTERDQREILGEFVAALRDDWTLYLRSALDEDAAARDASLARLRARWDEAYAPYLADYLTQQHLEYGIAIVSPTLGREGRFFQGDPANSADNIVAVGVAGWETSPDRALSGVVPELCFPVVRRAFAEVEAQFDDRLQAARASDEAATRCGEMLLEAHAAHLLPTYREAFPGGSVPARSETADGPAMDPTIEEILKRFFRSN
jgi:hypothetical protein